MFLSHLIFIECIFLGITKKIETKTLLDNNRSRNIEIFLPRFSLALSDLNVTLSEQLNYLTGDSKLDLDHVVALKRYVQHVI